MEQGQITPLELRLGYTFLNRDLLVTALTHKTYAFEASTPLEFNERLEFLGDSILNFIVAEQLYTSNKYFSEGELTRRRAIGVNNKLLADVARRLGIGEFLLLGRGEQKQGGAANQSNLANAIESLIGAIYLDNGLQAAREFIMQKVFTADYLF
jgi:ribonuclease III